MLPKSSSQAVPHLPLKELEEEEAQREHQASRWEVGLQRVQTVPGQGKALNEGLRRGFLSLLLLLLQVSSQTILTFLNDY